MEYIIAVLALLLGGGAGFFLARRKKEGEELSAKLREQIASEERSLQQLQGQVATAKGELKSAEAEAKAKAKEILAEAKILAQKERLELDKETARLEEKEKGVNEKAKEVAEQKGLLERKLEEVTNLRTELSKVAQTHREALEKVAKLTEAEAKEQLSLELKVEFSGHFASQIDLLKQEAERDVEERAKNLLAEAMQRYASEVAAESTVTVVQLPAEEMKGRIIGKEGRNISAFERATGVDVIIDDTPGAIVISGYDLVRRYVAKRAMEKLLEDGRIQPARIEEVVEAVKKEVGKMMVQFGQRALDELGISGYHADLVKVIGRLRFRTSYGQNVLKHSVEMAHLARMLAEEIGADPKITVEGALLHDIGKALDHEVTGTHVQIGVEICKRYKIRPEVIHCVEAHHEDVPMSTAEA
ncbi:MAG: Rnase Y domain-containing protein, partial [Patescibacteria group bacterium]